MEPHLVAVLTVIIELKIYMNKPTQILFDRLAISASALCALHCLAGPVLLVLFPFMLALPVGDHFSHMLMVWFVIPTSSIAVLLGCTRHKDPTVLVLAFFGIVGLAISAVYGHDFLGETGEKLATLIATFLLVTAHWRNYSLCRNDSLKVKGKWGKRPDGTPRK
jgi:nitrate reductase beta subunit